MLEILLVLALLPDAAAVRDGGFFYTERVDAMDLPACSPNSCNNNLGPACRMLAVPWTFPYYVPQQYLVSLGCRRAGHVKYGEVDACYCECWVGGDILVGPCTTTKLTAPHLGTSERGARDE